MTNHKPTQVILSYGDAVQLLSGEARAEVARAEAALTRIKRQLEDAFIHPRGNVKECHTVASEALDSILRFWTSQNLAARSLEAHDDGSRPVLDAKAGLSGPSCDCCT